MRHAGLCATIEEARRLICLPDNDFAWSGWADAADALAEIDPLLDALKADRLPDPRHLALLFAPTGPLQELSISSGWGAEFLALAERFDQEIEGTGG